MEKHDKKLEEAIWSLEIFAEIDNDVLNYEDVKIKQFLHTLCPKYIDEIDTVITQLPINKGNLKKIIYDSIYYELNACILSPKHTLTKCNTGINIDGNEMTMTDKNIKHCVCRRTGDCNFIFNSTNNTVSFSDYEREFYIETDDNSGILINYYGKNVEQQIEDNNLIDLAKQCLVFLQSVSLFELKLYYQTFTNNTSQNNEKELLSKETIISAMQKAQKAVEEMRNKEQVGPKKDNNENTSLNNHGDNSCDFCNLNCFKNCKGLCC